MTSFENIDDPCDFDGWLKANVFVGSIVAVVVLTMALAALYWGVDQRRLDVERFSLIQHADGSP